MKRLFTITLCALVISTHASFGQDDDMYSMSLEDLMNIKIEVSKTDLSLRETPSIISVISRREIQNMGARDLMDVLNHVPGFNFGVDVEGVVGVGIRGNWGHEGKVLVLIDGIEMNEILFATTQFGQHYDINNIDRIEIIRGPGSSIYGGYAELGVINIITQKGNQIKGVNVQTQIGAGEGGLYRSDISFGIGNGSEEKNYSFNGYVGQGTRSVSDYVDINGDAISLKGNSLLRPMMFNGGIKHNNFSLRALYDGYVLETVDQFGEIEPMDRVNFNTIFVDARYKLDISDKFNLTPRIGYKVGTPWGTEVDGTYPYRITATRITPVIAANWSMSDVIQVTGGVDSYFDMGQYNGPASDLYFGDSNSVTYSNIGAFVQAVYKSKFANLTVGARFDNHSSFGSAFSPRLGLTKIIDKVHMKLLYSRAFRAPAIENINSNPDIKPEKTGVAELEFGYKPNANNYFTLNLFDIGMNNPIVYEGVADSYLNFKKGGTRGVELEYRVNGDWGYIATNYAYYTSKGQQQVDLYVVPNNANRLLGFANSRWNLYGSFNISNSLTINPSISFIGKRDGITGLDVNDDYIFTEFDPQFFCNIFFRYTNGSFTGGIGVNDILDTQQMFIQPYASGHPEINGLGREFTARLAYKIPFKSKN